MESEEEAVSPHSAPSGSQSPNPNGRITVTIAAPPLERAVTLALPIQHPRQIDNNNNIFSALERAAGASGGGREDCWSEGATEVLIEAWGERYVELKRGNLRQNHWKEVADIVSSRDDYSKTPKTDNQCKNRIDTVKKKYKTEKQRVGVTGGRSSWRFFERLEELIGPSPKVSSGPVVFATAYEGENVPLGIPVNVSHFPHPPNQQNQQWRMKMKRKMESVEYERKEKKMERGFSSGSRSWGDSVRELSMAIVELGEAYQEAESMKLQQLMEMENKRMSFARELELQRTKFMAQTQMEISHMKRKLKEQRRDMEL